MVVRPDDILEERQESAKLTNVLFAGEVESQVHLSCPSVSGPRQLMDVRLSV